MFTYAQLMGAQRGCFLACLCPHRNSHDAAASQTPGESSSVSVMEEKRSLEQVDYNALHQRARRTVDDTEKSTAPDPNFEVDGSQFIDNYDIHALDPDDPGNREFIEALGKYVAYTDWVKKESSNDIDWSEKDRRFFLAKNPLGHLCAHYPPISETGKITNVAFNTHQRLSAVSSGGDGDTTPLILKLKSVCMRFQSMTIADLTDSYKDSESCTSFRVRLDDGDTTTVSVNNSSAALLRYDVFEKWPCCNVNDVDMNRILKEKIGPDELERGNDLFAELVQARRMQVGGRTPVLVWNRGTVDGKKFCGAQVGTFDALQRKCGKEYIYSTYHMAYMMNRSYGHVKIAAQYADEATYYFVESGLNQSKGKPKRGKNIPPGFWLRYHGMADLTPEQREAMHKLYREHMKNLHAIISEAWAAVEYDLMYEVSTATQAQKNMVQRMLAGRVQALKIKVVVEDPDGQVLTDFIGAVRDERHPSCGSVNVRFDRNAAKQKLNDLFDKGHDLLTAIGGQSKINLWAIEPEPIRKWLSILDIMSWPSERKVLLVSKGRQVKVYKGVNPFQGVDSQSLVKDFKGYRFYVYGGAVVSSDPNELLEDNELLEELELSEELPKSAPSSTSPPSTTTTVNLLAIAPTPVDKIVSAEKINLVASIMFESAARKKLKEFGCITKGKVKILRRRLAKYVEVHNTSLHLGSAEAQQVAVKAAELVV